VDGLVISDKEVRKLMLDREAWRSNIKMIVAKIKEVDASKREDRKTRCIKTRSAIVVVIYLPYYILALERLTIVY
jgi:hypothetical protein